MELAVLTKVLWQCLEWVKEDKLLWPCLDVGEGGGCRNRWRLQGGGFCGWEVVC
jgi:hypothetical protein